MPRDLFDETSAMNAATRALGRGEAVVVTGSEDGPFLMVAAEGVTPEAINLMATHGRGLVGVVLSRKRAAALGLELQPRQGRAQAPLYTRSVEAATGTTTGISAADRARTIRALAFGGAGDLVTPGHIFPQVTTDRATGQAELALRLVASATGTPVAALCTILDDTGEVAKSLHANAVAARLGLTSVDAVEVLALAGPEVFS